MEGAIGDGSVLVAATASAPEGDRVYSRWNEMGIRHFDRMGVAVHPLDVRERADAYRPEIAAAVDRCSMLFFSGGDPSFLSSTLVATPLLEAIRRMERRGAVYAGCSAGAMVAGAEVPGQRRRSRLGHGSGLGLRPGEVFGVHWDAPMLRPWRRVLAGRIPPKCRLVGIAERTCVFGDGRGWLVSGRGRVNVISNGRSATFVAGEWIAGVDGRPPDVCFT